LPTSTHTLSHLASSHLSIPFGKAAPAEDDLFPPAHPPADAAAPPQVDGAEEGDADNADNDDPDADADAMTGDCSDTSEESEEVSTSGAAYSSPSLKINHRTSNS
jgi:hypothetical protein